MLVLAFIAGVVGIAAAEFVTEGEMMEMAVGADGDITSFAQAEAIVNVRGQRGLRVAYGVQADGAAMAVGSAAAMDEMMSIEVVPDMFLLQTNLMHRRDSGHEEVAPASTVTVEIKEAGDVERLADTSSLMQTGVSLHGSGNHTATVEAAGAVSQVAATPVALVQTDVQVATEEASVPRLTGLGLQMAAGAPLMQPATVLTTEAPGWAESTGEKVKGVLLQSPGTIIVNAAKSLAAKSPWPAHGSSLLDKITVEPWKQRDLLVFLVAAVLMQMLLFRWLTPPMAFESGKSATAATPYIK